LVGHGFSRAVCAENQTGFSRWRFEQGRSSRAIEPAAKAGLGLFFGTAEAVPYNNLPV